MAGKPGQQGGGGARPNSGPKPRLNSNPKLETDDPAQFLRELMRDSSVDVKLRAEAAKKLLAADSAGTRDEGKKGAANRAAERASTGRFAPMAPPRLVAVK